MNIGRVGDEPGAHSGRMTRQIPHRRTDLSTGGSRQPVGKLLGISPTFTFNTPLLDVMPDYLRSGKGYG